MKTNLNFPNAGFRGGFLGGPAWAVAVGDSFTFGLGVNQEDTWTAQLAKLSRHEVINLGVPGWGPQQYTRTLEEYGIPLKPKVVLYGLFSNDVGNVTRFKNDEGHFNEFSFRRFLRSRSVTFNFFRVLRRAKNSVTDIDLDKFDFKFSSENLKNRIVADQRRFPEGWPLTRRQIETAYQDSQRSNATFVLLYFPSKEEVYWEAIKKEAKSLEPFDELIYQLRTATAGFCQSRRFLCIDPTAELKRRAGDGQKLYLSIDSHWNDAGTRVVAEEIYKQLLKQKIL